MDIIQVENLSFNYPDMEVKALNNISFAVKEGEFVVLAGASGSGKSTLLRMLKQELAPHGHRTGRIYYDQKPLEEWDERKRISSIGFVFQDPENQIVMDQVLQEITFGMEQMNIPSIEMKKRLAELVHFFGLEHLLYDKTTQLSGGQKQLINLLSVLLLRPKVLLLDEPTSQLDPVAAKELLQILERLNDEMGITIIMVEHRLEELYSMADQVIFLHSGEIVHNGKSRKLIAEIVETNDQRFIPYLPSVSRFFLANSDTNQAHTIPLTVKEMRQWLLNQSATIERNIQPNIETRQTRKPLLIAEKIQFQYEKDAPIVLKNCSLTVHEGEFFALVGGNGTGKTTLLQLCMGMLKQQRGKLHFQGKKLSSMKTKDIANHFAYLPQHPLAFYIEDTIGKEMDAIIQKRSIENGEVKKQSLCEQLQITHLLDRHPNDLSGGELQRATIACLLLDTPTILCIDEPTKGLDPIAKEQLAIILKDLQMKGLTIFMVTHDIEFAVSHVDRCAILFDRHIVAEGTPAELFKGNYFYTTTMNRATAGSCIGEQLTLEEALQAWSKIEICI